MVTTAAHNLGRNRSQEGKEECSGSKKKVGESIEHILHGLVPEELEEVFLNEKPPPVPVPVPVRQQIIVEHREE